MGMASFGVVANHGQAFSTFSITSQHTEPLSLPMRVCTLCQYICGIMKCCVQSTRVTPLLKYFTTLLLRARPQCCDFLSETSERVDPSVSLAIGDMTYLLAGHPDLGYFQQLDSLELCLGHTIPVKEEPPWPCSTSIVGAP